MHGRSHALLDTVLLRSRLYTISSIAISARHAHPFEDAVLIAVGRLGGHKTAHSQEEALENEQGKNAVSITLQKLIGGGDRI